MIGLDTNVLVRYLVQDDPDQSAAAALIDGLSESRPGYLSLVTVVETYWVLRRAYRMDVAACTDVLEGLLDAHELRIGEASAVRAAVGASRDGADFADAVIAELGRAAGCDSTVTFDSRAAGIRGMRLLEVPPVH